ncbi:UNVERIFIED_CONTAM: CCR4-NOT transcription complex subunit, partial [Sesamum radiatum]
KNFCMSQIAELCANPMVFESTELIQQILMFLNRSEGLSKHVDSFMQMLSLIQLKEGAKFILAPFLPDELREDNFFRHIDLLNEGVEDDFDAILAEMEKEISMADVMSELGYGCTVNVSQCKEMLSLFLPLSDATIAKIIGTIARTYSGLDDNQTVFATFRSALGGNSILDLPPVDSWDGEVLVDSIKQLSPGINWINVMEKLDHEGFYIPNEAAFSFFMFVYKHACQDPFPLHAICGSVWNNIEGQLSFLKHAVSVSPEVFTFAHSERQLSFDDAVIGDTFQQVNYAWSCRDLLEVLCQIAERGHASAVRSLLEYPLTRCPEVLLLGMAHVNTAYNLIQNEVASALIPMALKNASGNSLILNLWHVSRSMLLRGLIDAVHLDQDNISRILDVCQELKILSPVLDMIPFHFGIRLAALASKKEIMDLENWLSTHLATNKDAFYEECLRFVKDVQIGAQDVSANRFHPPGALLNIYLEACPTVLKVLQSHAGAVSSSLLAEEMENYADDIEAESNAYFHQMFSGQLGIDAMIQMLTRFKESLDKREQSIFECMIGNLFEEYKFFSKYPERQLRIAAVLFGSLIKHQLVTHLTLGIALRAVLDALRKPADSKMFSFGTKALEQFVDRLIEWPQYCNHILQISHLRAAHADLVAFIERALNRISTAHAEPDIVHNATSDHHHGPIQSAVNMEVPGSSFSLIGPGSAQTGLLVSSPIQLPQRPTSSLDDRKTSLSNYMKPAQFSGGQPANAPSSDTAGIQKARFGSALNIETLVAAAERRETPIECSKYSKKLRGAVCQMYGLQMHQKKKTVALAKMVGTHNMPNLTEYPLSTWMGNFAILAPEIFAFTFYHRNPLGHHHALAAPASEIQDKISFIINNLSAANVEAKAKEFTEILNEQYYPWFAQYMVMKRASIETNFHDLYLKFLDKVNLKALNKEIVQATYENCKVLLGSELIKSSVEERSLLKNLGSWLGKITIGKNQVLRAREIDPKSLIIEAYEKGLMIAVIPFTSKVLFKNLGVDLKEVTPTSLLKDRVREYGAPLHHSSGTLTEDEKLVSLGFSDQLPSAPGLLQGQTQFSVNQLPVPAANIEQQVVVNKKLQAYGLHLHFQRFESCTPDRMDRAVKEIVSSIVQRSVSIATQTTKELVLKDYAMEPDETLIRNAAHLMEPLRGSISGQLRSSLQGLSISSELLEQAVQLVTNDNLDLGCVLIEQAATEKAVQTIDGEIAQQLSIRRKHRESVGPTFYDASLYAQGFCSVSRAESLQQSSNAVPVGPSASSAVGGLSRQFASASGQIAQASTHLAFVSSTQIAIGDGPQALESDTIASFTPASTPDLQVMEPSNSVKESGTAAQPINSALASEHPGSNVLEPLLTTGDALDKYQTISEKLENLLSNDAKEAEIQGVIAEVPAVILRCISRDEAALAVAQKGLYENASNSAHVDAHLAILAAIRDVSKLVVKELTSWVIYSEEDRKFNKDITIGLIRSELLNLAEYNVHMAKLLDAGRNKAATEFVISLIQTLLAARPGSPESLQQLVEIAKNPASAATLSPVAVGKEDNTRTSRDKKVFDLVSSSLLLCFPGASREDYAAAELVDSDPAGFHEQPSPSHQGQPLSFLAIDICAKLVFSILKFCPVDQGSNKLSLLPKVLAVTVKFIQKDAEEKKTSFNPRPFFRLFVNWLLDLCSLDPVFDGANFQVLTALANSFHAIQPLKVPGFSFAWLELVSHRSFMPKLLTANAQKGWPYFQRLLVDLFQFMEPFLRNAELGEPVHFLYKGTLRVLLVLLHDFPEFLCDYHFSFCDVIPPSCIQMRNIILSAFPRNMRLPDPSTPNLKIDLLAEISQSPRILSEVDAALKAKQIKSDVDEYLKTRQQGSSFLAELKQKLLLSPTDAARAGTRYNVPLINSLVLYVGMQAIQQLQARAPSHSQSMASMTAFLVSAALDIFQTLIMDLDTEGRYLFLNAVANQLRYPNNHTHYFSFILLYLFAESNQEMIQEQITRVLLERLIVNRPHPWGLLITFIELIKNPRYNFWSRSFTRCAPEIEKLFESVSRSCGGPKPVDDSVVSGGIPDNMH